MAEFAGLVLSVFSAISFFIGGYQSFIVSKSMMKKLYSEVPDSSDYDENYLDTEANSDATKAFEKRISAVKSFRFGFWTYRLISFIENCCCCLSSCCQRNCQSYRKHVKSLKKYHIAR